MPARPATWFTRAEAWELFLTTIDATSVEWTRQAPPLRDHRRVDGVAVRVIRGGRLGTATCTSWQDVPATVRAARRGASVGSPTPIVFPEPAPLPAVSTFDAGLAEAGVDDVADWVDQVLGTGWPKQVANACVTVRKEITRRRVLNHKGIDISHPSTKLTMILAGGASDGFDRVRAAEQSCRGDIDVNRLCSRFAARFGRCSGARVVVPQAGPTRALFSPSAAATLLHVLERVLVDVVNASHTRLLDDLRREPVLATTVSIADHGADDWTPGAAPFDDEGVPKHTFKVVDRGSLETSIVDLRTAALLGVPPTGNGARRFDSQPTARFSSPALAPGLVADGDLVTALDNGLGIEQLRDPRLRPGTCGDFDARVSAGYTVRRGRPAGPVRNLRVRANLFGLLGADLLAVGDAPPRAQGGSPSILAKNLYVYH